MSTKPLTLICPQAQPTDKSEAELFGAMVWLWMHSSTHRNCPLHELHRVLLPALQTGQFALALNGGADQRPVGVMTWAMFTADMEQRYLRTLDRSLQPQDWQQGDRPWILDWVAPFGRTHEMKAAIRRALPRACWRSLHHRGDEIGLRVLHSHGVGTTRQQAAEFWAARPLAQTQQGKP